LKKEPLACRPSSRSLEATDLRVITPGQPGGADGRQLPSGRVQIQRGVGRKPMVLPGQGGRAAPLAPLS
jgi:hypothetical protein